MTVRPMTEADVDWAVDVLGHRREPLVKHAPIFWRPATGVAATHGAYLRHLLASGARGYRTDTALLIAAPQGDGRLVDDAHVPGPCWAEGDGRALWDALAADCEGAPVRLVCPAYEQDRVLFARAAGLQVAETWWLHELTGSGGGEPGRTVTVAGADGITVEAPPVYAPPGPILLIKDPDDVAAAAGDLEGAGREAGCAAVVVSLGHDTDGDAAALEAHGFRCHCFFFAGTVAPLPAERPKVEVRRSLADLAPEGFPGWTTRSLADLGDTDFVRVLLAASEGDPFETSTPETAMADLEEMRVGAGAAFDADQWLVVEDDKGPIGVVLPQRHARHPTNGTLFYLGVLPERRGEGLGTRLHRFGLQRLAELGVATYRGSTDVDNAPMRAVFAANGCAEE